MEPTLQDQPNKPIRLRNTSCAYCGVTNSADNPLEREHVIGRRFVPKGTLARGWSLQVRACRRCNGEKADLENDISAITLLRGHGRAREEGVSPELIIRKATRSISRRTKKPVAESSEEMRAWRADWPPMQLCHSGL